MIDQMPGLRPVFLNDHQKTLAKLVNPVTGEIDVEGNRGHRLPKTFTASEFEVAARLVEIMGRSRYALNNPNQTIHNILDGVSWSLIVAENVFARLLTEEGEYAAHIDPEVLLPYETGKTWEDISVGVSRFERRPEVREERQLEEKQDDITNWKICPEGLELLRVVYDELKCPQLVLSGIFSEQISEMDQSFREQDEADKYLTGPKYLLRSRVVRSSLLHKGLIHMIFQKLGVPTVAVDEDPNAIGLITRLVGVPGCLVSSPEEAVLYAPGACNLDLIKEPYNAPIFQIGRDGGSPAALARKAFLWWQGSLDKVLDSTSGKEESKRNFSSEKPNLGHLATSYSLIM